MEESEIIRSDLHFGRFQRVIVASPGPPVDALSMGEPSWTLVLTVKVGIMATVVPPSTLERLCTRFTAICVIVLVWSAELHSESATGHRVTFIPPNSSIILPFHD